MIKNILIMLLGICLFIFGLFQFKWDLEAEEEENDKKEEQRFFDKFWKVINVIFDIPFWELGFSI
ncbi:hypothetical protein [Ectobacillus panaciterrae]|uniref:hypothetical protein n=1 Tax=Ectobacillus panaciterrae TaxID=363872 RepID=UPI00041DC0C1|nr:hypothetical protein [Ectobacillus panaciterrae]